MQHVMYDDIMSVRRYITYPYYKNGFDVDDDDCLYSYARREMELRAHLEKYASDMYVPKIITAAKAITDVSENDEIRLYNLFSIDNPSVRLTIYSGAHINDNLFLNDLRENGDIKKALIELTGEINAAAIDGLLTLFASALKHLEGKEHTTNTKVLKNYYKRLRNTSYVYMKRGSATEFFIMPIADLKKAIDNKDVDLLMESGSRFLDVYMENNTID